MTLPWTRPGSALQRWMEGRSIRWKATVGLTLLILAGVLFQVWYFPERQSEQATRALSAKGQSLVRLLGATLAYAWVIGDDVAAGDILKGAQGDPDLEFLVLLHPDGTPMASVNGERAPSFAGRPRGEFDPGPTGLREVQDERLTFYAAVRPQSTRPGVLVAGFSTAGIARERRQGQFAAGIIGLLSLGVGVGLTFLLTRGIARRMERLGRLAERVASGDLKRAAVEAEGLESGDEIGRMSRSTVAMVRSLNELSARAFAVAKGDLSVALESQGDLADAFRAMLDSLRRLVGEISGGSHTIDVTLSEIVAASRQQENAATEQASAIEETRLTMDSLLESSRSIAKSSELVLQNAELTLRNNKLIAERYAQLSAQVQRITEILELIKDIANKSDLLALNASLEGTKAGEAGRGFSLVAAQMQRLAENVMASVQDIKKLVSDIREASQAAVLATEEGTRLADATTEMARQIRFITQQQQTGTEQVTQSMDEAAGQLSQTVAGIKQMTDSMQGLTTVSGRLTELIRAFRLS